MLRRFATDAAFPEAGALGEATAVIRAGGIVALPTDTLYGLAADPFSRDAVARLFAVKGRTLEHAVPLIAADGAQVVAWIGPLAGVARRLAERFWPGPLTLLMPAPAALVPAVVGGSGNVGVRVPAHEVARALCRACGRPLTATSANLSGEPPSADPSVIARTLGDRIDLLLDAGPTPGGSPSTIVDASGPQLRLVRPGAIPWNEVQACAARG